MVSLVYWFCLGFLVVLHGLQRRALVYVRICGDFQVSRGHVLLRRHKTWLLTCLAPLSQTQWRLQPFDLCIGVEYGCKDVSFGIICFVSNEMILLNMVDIEGAQWFLLWIGSSYQGKNMYKLLMLALWMLILILKFGPRGLFIRSDVENTEVLRHSLLLCYYRIIWQQGGLRLHKLFDDTRFMVVLRRKKDKYNPVAGYGWCINISITYYGWTGPRYAHMTSSAEVLTRFFYESAKLEL